jgi:hypothetical protein
MGRLVGIFCLEGSQSLACREMKGRTRAWIQQVLAVADPDAPFIPMLFDINATPF